MSQQKLQHTLKPEYMKDFRCIGPDCEDTCCAGWTVTIDRATYKQYNNVRDPQMAKMFDDYIVRNRKDPVDSSYALVKLNPDGGCPFLTQDHLCHIQKSLGADYLSDTCSFYPRMTNRVNDVFEQSATLSCPEAARLALLNPNGIGFDESAEAMEHVPIHLKANANDPAVAGKPAQYLWELRNFAIDVLQDRTYRLAERLIILGMFCQRLQQQTDEGRVAETPQLIGSYLTMMAHGGMKAEVERIPSVQQFQERLAKALLDERFGMGSISRLYRTILVETLSGIGCTDTATDDEVVAGYRAAFSNYYHPFMKEREYLLENYLVNSVFRSLFPLHRTRSIFGAYVMLVVDYALAKLHLVGIAGFRHGLSDDDVVRVIQSLSRTFEHNAAYAPAIYALLERNNLTTMAAMAMLIQDPVQ